jgi:hypothetical protein
MLNKLNLNQKSPSPQLKVKTRLKVGARSEGVVVCLMDARSLQQRGYPDKAEKKLVECQRLAQNARL